MINIIFIYAVIQYILGRLQACIFGWSNLGSNVTSQAMIFIHIIIILLSATAVIAMMMRIYNIPLFLHYLIN